jgi:hypothetical protein
MFSSGFNKVDESGETLPKILRFIIFAYYILLTLYAYFAYISFREHFDE